MRTRLTLTPGAPGTRQLLTQFGDRLLYVRYRYDEARGVRIKTAEIIIDERPWTPRPKPAPLDYVHVRLPEPAAQSPSSPDHHPSDLEKAIHRLGGTFHEPTQTYRLTYAATSILQLTDCIVVST
ncbi:MAG TPA: hypothetical protein VGF48_09585 [Thermoanaerobaculia bacterium]